MVIVSHPDRASNKPVVDVVICTSKRATREPDERSEILLDQADGLDWPTICKCDLIYAAPRGEITHRKGHVSEARRSQLIRKIIASHNWPAVLV